LRFRVFVPDVYARPRNQGFGEAEEEVYCRHFYLELEIRFPVKECTFYEDKRIASLTAMEEIAWFLTTRKPGRAVGFISAEQFREEQEAEAAKSKKAGAKSS
jgi:hypothetical protein